MEFLLKQNTQWLKTKTDCLIIPLLDQKNPLAALTDLDTHLQGLLTRLHNSKDLRLAKGKTTLLHCPEQSFQRLLLVGCGNTLNMAGFRDIIKTISKEIEEFSFSQAHLIFDITVENYTTAQCLQQAANLLASQPYKYDTTLSKKARASTLKKLTFLTDASNANKKAVAQGLAMANGITLAKQLGNLPPNICTPTYLAKEAQLLAKKSPHVTTQILNEPELKKLKMGSLLSVTAGTEEPAKFIIIQYKGAKSSAQPYVLVGKGVTFDSGGISLKPGPKMDEMKFDMCGAASVLGALQAVIELALPLNVIGIIPAVENLPSGKATKPGDVVTSMSTQTIEVLNTDAEGRLILCDALTYAERFKPKAVIDIATLTGACIVALGKHASGLYSNKEELSKQLIDAGNATYDRAWPMPLWDDYNQQLSSKYADMGNIGGPEGGSVTAACFLSRFTKKYDWAHLDIAGPAWDYNGEKGATGRPVSLLTQYLIDRC